MRRHPDQGVPGAKPRLRKVITEEDGEVEALNREYLQGRNRLQWTKAHEAAVTAAHRREQLIERGLVVDQAKFLMVCFRRKILLAPTQWAARIAAQNESVDGISEHAISRILDEGVRELLEDLRTLPARITDERWADRLVEDGNGSGDD